MYRLHLFVLMYKRGGRGFPMTRSGAISLVMYVDAHQQILISHYEYLLRAGITYRTI